MTSRVAGVSFVFCDLVGSTALLAELGEATNDEVRRDLFEVLRQPVLAFHGTEVKSQGDGLMVAFQTSPSHAVGCAIAMHQAVVRLSSAEGCPRLAIRAGISCGEVTSEAGDWFGAPVVEAARLCGLAQPGQILITDHALRTDSLIDTELGQPVGQLTLKGFPEKVSCSEISWAKPPVTAAQVPTPPTFDLAGQPAAAGISARLDSALRAWAEVRGGASRALLVNGPPRTGRTRFVAELLAAIDDDCYPVCTTAAQPWSSPEAVVGDAFRLLAMWGPSSLVEQLDEVAGLRSLVPALGLRLSRSQASSGLHLGVDPVLVFAAALRRLSRDRPVAFVVEDLHRANVATVDVLKSLMKAVDGERVWFVFTCRGSADESSATMATLQGALDVEGGQRIELDQLTERDVRALVSPHCHDPGRALSVARSILDLVGGAAGDVIDAVNRVLPALELEEGEVSIRALLSPCVPYKGLLALGQDDQSLFFGRDQLVTQVIDRLESLDFVALVGASGSGKSSLLRAGVGNRIRSAGRAVTVGTPNDRLLMRAVSAGRIRCGTLIIDQFEEFFTLWSEEDRGVVLEGVFASLGSGLIEALALGIRSDFFGNCAEHPSLASRLGDTTILVGPLAEQDLRMMIELPAAAARLVLDSGFADVIVSDLGEERHPLPLLSHTLFETWRQRAVAGRLALDDYHAAGGIRGSIARSAERVFTSQLDESEQRVARQLLLRLVEPGDDHRPPTRRPIRRADVTDTFGQVGDVVLEVFVAARLLVADGGVVELAHEAILSQWPRLADWIAQDRDELTTAAHLARSATEWVTRDRPPTDLYRGARLDAAQALVEAGRPLTPIERDFVAAGVELRDRERLQLRRTNRRLRRQLAGASIAAVLAIGATVVAVAQRQTATRQRRQAELALLASTAADLATSRVDVAALLAVEANRLQPTAGSLGALESVLRTQPSIIRSLYPAFLSGGGSLVAVSADLDTAAFLTADALTVVDTMSLESLATIHVDKAQAVALSPTGDRIAVSGASSITIFAVADGAAIARSPLQEVESVPDGRLSWINDTELFITPTNGDSREIDARSGKVERQWKNSPAGLAVSNPQTQTFVDLPSIGPLAAPTYITEHHAGSDVTTRLSWVAERRMVLTWATALLSASYSPNEQWLAIGTDQGVALMHRDGSVLSEVGLPAQPPVRTTAIFSFDGTKLATFAATGQVTLYDLRNADHVSEILHSNISGSSRTGYFSPVNNSLFVVAGDHLIEMALDDREPLATATFGHAGDVPLATRTDGTKTLGIGLTGFAAYDPETGSTIPDYASYSNVPWWYSPDDSSRVAFDFDDNRYVLENDQGREIRKPAFTFDPSGILYVNDTYTVLAETDARGAFLALHDPRTFEPIETPVVFRAVAGVPSLAVSEDGTMIARSYKASSDGSAIIEVLDLKTAHAVVPAVRLPDGHPDITALAFAPDGRFLTFGDDRGGIGDIDLTTGHVEGGAYQGATGSILFLSYQLDGSHLLAVLGSVAAMWWDTASHDPVGIPIAGAASSFDVVVSDSSFVWATTDLLSRHLVVSVAGGLRRWNFDFDTWPSIACERAGRNLTRDEWDKYLPAGEPYHATCAQFPAARS